MRGESPAIDETTDPTPEVEASGEQSTGTTVRRIFSTIAKISGVVVLLLAAGVAALFVLNRRRM